MKRDTADTYSWIDAQLELETHGYSCGYSGRLRDTVTVTVIKWTCCKLELA